jgi:hypothetical protein
MGKHNFPPKRLRFQRYLNFSDAVSTFTKACFQLLTVSFRFHTKITEVSSVQQQMEEFSSSASFIFSMALQPLGGLGRFIFRGFTITLRHTTIGRNPLDE